MPVAWARLLASHRDIFVTARCRFLFFAVRRAPRNSFVCPPAVELVDEGIYWRIVSAIADARAIVTLLLQVHVAVGGGEQLFRIGAVGRKERAADAEREHLRAADFLADLDGDLADTGDGLLAIVASHARDQQHEFVATHARAVV